MTGHYAARVIIALICVLQACLAHAQLSAVRPSPDGTPTVVQVAVYVLDIDRIIGAEQTFTGSVYLEARWNDPSLAHGRKAIKRPLDQIWHPQLQIANLQRSWQTFPETAEILSNGDVVYRQRYWGWFVQPLELRKFPFDRQMITIPVVAVGYGIDEIQIVSLTRDGVTSGVSPKLSLPDWTLEAWVAKPERYAPYPEGHGMPSMTLTMEVKRHWGSFVFKVMLPLCLIVAMSWICFWLGPEQIGSNVSVAVTSMLTIVAYRFSIGQMIPMVPYLTRLDAFIFVSMLMVFMTVVQVTVDASLVRRNRIESARRLVRHARIAYPSLFLIIVTLIVFTA